VRTPTSATIWRNRDFRLLTGGQVVSQLGNSLQGLALPLIVLSITGSTAQAGTILGISTATYLIAGLAAGAFVDRWDRKRTMIWCELGRAALTVTVPIALLCNAISMPQLYAVAIVTGILTVLFQTANSSALPHIVPAGQLPDALGATQAMGSATGIVGSAIAGATYAVARAIPFAFNVFSFVVSALTLRAIRPDFQETQQNPSGQRLLREIHEGLSWIWRQPVVRLLTVVEAADGIRFGAGYLLIIQLARHAGANPTRVGLVFTGAAIGGLLGGLLASRVVRRHRLGRVAITMLWIEALSFPLYAAYASWLFIALVAFLESVLTPIYSVAMDNYRLAITPDRLRGRVNGALSTVVTGATAVGTILGGVLLTRVSAPAMAIGSGGWLLALAVLTTASRTIRSS
jgi:MFS family permease